MLRQWLPVRIEEHDDAVFSDLDAAQEIGHAGEGEVDGQDSLHSPGRVQDRHGHRDTLHAFGEDVRRHPHNSPRLGHSPPIPVESARIIGLQTGVGPLVGREGVGTELTRAPRGSARIRQVQDEFRALEPSGAHEAPRRLLAVADPLDVRIRRERTGEGAGEGYGITGRIQAGLDSEALYTQDLLRRVGQPRNFSSRVSATCSRYSPLSTFMLRHACVMPKPRRKPQVITRSRRQW
jgi:hypothetical protein